MGRAEETEKENLKIHQLNLNLAGELEDYRHQTKTLMADLRAKEEEIASLRETVGTRGQLSSDVSDTYSVLGAGHVCDCVCVCVYVCVCVSLMYVWDILCDRYGITNTWAHLVNHSTFHYTDGFVPPP